MYIKVGKTVFYVGECDLQAKDICGCKLPAGKDQRPCQFDNDWQEAGTWEACKDCPHQKVTYCIFTHNPATNASRTIISTDSRGDRDDTFKAIIDSMAMDFNLIYADDCKLDERK